ncbi:MAG: hypothetical protein H7A21_04440 [Spirochaetales bacterium]|nr:hypothetical protein [Leptospiraceae bacterium]MCP5480663.1 hypothetical protein [Spirochaetales bacterium]MCP5484015.1 hypothetical protein [Spirochaetales bacterium]
MSRETIRNRYVDILNELAAILVDDELKHIVQQIGLVDDPADDLDLDDDAPAPTFWVDVLRLPRLGLHQQAAIDEQYDAFVKAYQELTRISHRDEDQERLLQEIGDLLYRLDELTGARERLTLKLAQALSQGIKEVHGILMDRKTNLAQSTVRADQALRLTPAMAELRKNLRELGETIRIMGALARVRDLIVPSQQA